MSKTLVHLVRHAEVHNPNNIWYGRLEGFDLSERGFRQAEELAGYFGHHEIQAVYSSPLSRAMQTSSAIATMLGVEVQIDQDLIETGSRLEGKAGGWRVIRNPWNLRHFMNPMLPSWGEPYVDVRARMAAAIERIRRAHEGKEAIAVSHMTPILVARLFYGQNPRPPWRAGLPCERASVTTLEFEGDRCISTDYRPVGSHVF